MPVNTPLHGFFTFIAMNKSERLLSLDAFRGFTMASMVLVNNPGSWEHIYPQLEHAAWNGWTFTDCIFPFFLWIVGVAITFSLSSRRRKGATTNAVLIQIVRRTLVLFFMGIVLNGFPFGLIGDASFSLSSIRIPGVLQRIAIGYCCASILYLYASTRGIGIAIGALLSGYWILMTLLPVAGIELGSMEMGKNFASYIDSIFLSGHMWKNTMTWDPEGIVSTLPAIASTLFGVLTGKYLQSAKHSPGEKTNWMIVVGSGMIFLGIVLDMWLPINKSLWTSSYSIMMAGWATVLFAIVYFILDVKHITWWSFPFIVYGSNAITAYCLSAVQESVIYAITTTIAVSAEQSQVLSLKDYWMATFFFPYAAPLNASLLYGLCTVGAMYCILWVMLKNKWIVKI